MEGDQGEYAQCSAPSYRIHGMLADESGSLSPQVLLAALRWQGPVKSACFKLVLLTLKPLEGLTFLMGTIPFEFKPDRPDFTSSTPNLYGRRQNGSAPLNLIC